MTASDDTSPRRESANGASCEDTNLSDVRHELIRRETEAQGDWLIEISKKLKSDGYDFVDFYEELQEVRDFLAMLVDLEKEGSL